MSKAKLVLLILFLSNFFLNPRIAQAYANCTIDPNEIFLSSDQNFPPANEKYNFKITVPSTDPMDKFNVTFLANSWFPDGDVTVENLTPDSNGLLSGGPVTITVPQSNRAAFDARTQHTAEVKRQGAPGTYCTMSYKVTKTFQSQQTTCDIPIVTPNNESSSITLNGTIKPENKYRFYIPSVGRSSGSFSPDISGKFPEQNMGKLNAGTYQIFLQKEISVLNNQLGEVKDWENTNCQKTLVIMLTSDLPNPGAPTSTGTTTPAGPGVAPQAAQVCVPENHSKDCTTGGGSGLAGCTDNKNNPGISTAIGCIHTIVSNFISDIFKFILAICGGIAFLMMIMGSFQMITSRGNPQSLQAGRERFTSALIGLLFIIFSVLILQIIGTDLLGIFPK